MNNSQHAPSSSGMIADTLEKNILRNIILYTVAHNEPPHGLGVIDPAPLALYKCIADCGGAASSAEIFDHRANYGISDSVITPLTAVIGGTTSSGKDAIIISHKDSLLTPYNLHCMINDDYFGRKKSKGSVDQNYFDSLYDKNKGSIFLLDPKKIEKSGIYAINDILKNPNNFPFALSVIGGEDILGRYVPSHKKHIGERIVIHPPEFAPGKPCLTLMTLNCSTIVAYMSPLNGVLSFAGIKDYSQSKN